MVMGTHIARLVRMPNPSLFLALVLFLSLVRYTCGAGGDTETESLLTFKDSLTIASSLNNWNASVPPCIGDIGNWVGVLCHDSKVIGLQLENMGLAGTVNIESLGALHELRSLSLMNNNFDGKLPDVKNLSMLKALYLSNNRFSGEISDEEFHGMLSLKRVFLANNAFTGKVPKSLTTLPKLAILKLEGNQFSGVIPEFYGKELKVVNLANNQFEGPIPESLSKMDTEARPELKEVVKEIEELREEDDDDDVSSTIGEVNAVISGENGLKDEESFFSR
ncbi:hypothetical protein GOBAR_AA31906 [Gossypium barbadense]|uniref:Leucine-rich repeat-containing N-terminal plant-type domain-containing protein n=1 Tax=Gossypium barbadense TaxID=3634 RepID=A0A2P5WCH7_GOSBA|nr:hypothetical protein GOBAR_AA31906 [Gossypium barbadense]